MCIRDRLPVGRAKLTTAPSRQPKKVRDKAKKQYKPTRPPSIPAQAWDTFTVDQQIAYWDDILNQAEQAQMERRNRETFEQGQKIQRVRTAVETNRKALAEGQKRES